MALRWQRMWEVMRLTKLFKNLFIATFVIGVIYQPPEKQGASEKSGIFNFS
jgi:hypothetical protein